MTTGLELRGRQLERRRVLAAWWDRLVREDHIGAIFVDPPRTFEQFCQRLEGCPIYAEYAQGEDVSTLAIGAVLWGRRWLRGIFIGVWLAREYRRKKSGLRMVDELFALAFQEHPVLLASTLRGERAGLFEAYGFRGMTIPELGPSGDVWFGWMTAATWPRRTGGETHG